MEPGSEEPGDGPRARAKPPKNKLQWSRAPKSPVTGKQATPELQAVSELQWSRAPKSPVTAPS